MGSNLVASHLVTTFVKVGESLRHSFAIIDRENNRIFGVVGFHKDSLVNREARWLCVLIKKLKMTTSIRKISNADLANQLIGFP